MSVFEYEPFISSVWILSHVKRAAAVIESLLSCVGNNITFISYLAILYPGLILHTSKVCQQLV